jgi:5-methylcytosine-specific restriction protein B
MRKLWVQYKINSIKFNLIKNKTTGSKKMIEKLNWIKEAKEHFEKNGGKDYSLDKTIAEKSKQINNKLQTILKKKLENDNEVELNIQGSKWNIQGQNTLSAGIWYRAYYKKFGKNYPVVFGVYIGKNGLNIAIQIYNNILNKNLELLEKLGKIIGEVIDKEKFEEKDRDNEDERYKDFGFFEMDEWDDDKFQQVLDAYKKAVYKINETVLLKAIEEFNTFLKKPSDIPHLQFDVKGDFYKNKKEIKNNFEEFLKNPTFKNLEWWDKSINSANMQGNRTNLIKKIEGLTLEEIKKLDDDYKLEKIEEIFKNIQSIIYNEDNRIKDDLTFEEVEKAIEEIEGMNSTAKELAYYIQMEEDKIPLVNSTAIETIKHIEKVTKIFDDEQIKTLQNKIDRIKELIEIPENIEFKNYYIVDQFFNLFHKIKYDELSKKEVDGYKDLYQYAYLFANLLGKADKKGVEKDSFLEMLKKSKNIIYYGAPGTGKTYEIKSNIENIVEDIDKQFVMTQFHPSYTYEDFIEGIKPAVISENSVNLKLKDGEFRIFCDKAKVDEDNFLNEKDFYEAIRKYGYFFFVDEINRAELSRVFGELLYSLEYRGKEGKIKTQYASMREEHEQYFYIPKNLFFIGTMNDVDRSIDSFDLALRRRFLWIKKECNYQLIENRFGSTYKKACEALNNFIIKIDALGEKYQIGHAYFLKIEHFMKKEKISQVNLNELFEFHLEPLLTEYLRVVYDEQNIKKYITEAQKKFKL